MFPHPTPAFVVDAAALERNLAILGEVKRRTGCRILLALKAFSMFSVFPRMRRVLDGCCASSVHEARLARETFGGEVHAFAAAFSETEMREIVTLADHVTLNSFAQFRLFQRVVAESGRDVVCGLRINPEHSEGAAEIYDPCAPRSRLGVRRAAFDGETLHGVTGLHSHTLCEQNAAPFVRTLAAIEKRFGDLLPRLSWINFGGGHHITRSDYDLDLLCDTLNAFRTRHPNIETIYLEPGEACALNAGTLVATVLDVVDNDMSIAILDASCACHMPDVLEMPYRPRPGSRHRLCPRCQGPHRTACGRHLPRRRHHRRLVVRHAASDWRPRDLRRHGALHNGQDQHLQRHPPSLDHVTRA